MEIKDPPATECPGIRGRSAAVSDGQQTPGAVMAELTGDLFELDKRGCAPVSGIQHSLRKVISQDRGHTTLDRWMQSDCNRRSCESPCPASKLIAE